MSDIIQYSIDAVREQINSPNSQMWAGARGYDNFRNDNPQLQPGEKAIKTIRGSDIDPVYQKAVEEVREGLSQYPITGGVDYRHEDGSHILEHIYKNKTGSIGTTAAAIGQFILENNIKGHTTTSPSGMSSPKKMWGHSEDTPTWACEAGATLRQMEGSVCRTCLVDGNQNMRYDETQKHQNRNLLGLADPHMYAAALSWQLGQTGDDLIRLNTSGDIQSPHHYAIFSDVARAHPDKTFWLATRERRKLRQYLKAGGNIPPNLTVRVSDAMEGEQAAHDSRSLNELMALHDNIVASSVSSSPHYEPGEVWNCPAAGKPGDKGMCEHWNCKACWDPSVKYIDYEGHTGAPGAKGWTEEEHFRANENEIWTQLQLRDQMIHSQKDSPPDLSQFGL
jgi:hypothetical protein